MLLGNVVTELEQFAGVDEANGSDECALLVRSTNGDSYRVPLPRGLGAGDIVRIELGDGRVFLGDHILTECCQMLEHAEELTDVITAAIDEMIGADVNAEIASMAPGALCELRAVRFLIDDRDNLAALDPNGAHPVVANVVTRRHDVARRDPATDFRKPASAMTAEEWLAGMDAYLAETVGQCRSQHYPSGALCEACETVITKTLREGFGLAAADARRYAVSYRAKPAAPTMPTPQAGGQQSAPRPAGVGAHVRHRLHPDGGPPPQS